jgi:hypothetical protein
MNDGTIMTISQDRVSPRYAYLLLSPAEAFLLRESPLGSKGPDTWKLREIFTLSTVLAVWLVASTLVLFVVTRDTGFWQDVRARPLPLPPPPFPPPSSHNPRHSTWMT